MAAKTVCPPALPLRQLDLDVLTGFSAARAEVEPVTDFRLHLLDGLSRRRRADRNSSGLRAVVCQRPLAAGVVQNGTRESHHVSPRRPRLYYQIERALA